MDKYELLNWHDLKFLLMLSQYGGAKSAGAVMGVSHQTVSRRLAQLEQTLGMRLVNKHRHPWTLTAKGEEVCEMAVKMNEVAQDIVQFSSREQAEFTGSVSITCVQWGFELLVLPVLQRLRVKHPKLTFHLISDDAPLDVQSGKADLALRFTKSPPPDLIGRQIGPIALGVYGLGGFMEQLDKGQFGNVPLVKVNSFWGGKKWPGNEGEFQAVVTVNDFSTLVASVRHGLGVAVLPMVIGRQFKELIVSQTAKLKTQKSAWLLRNEDSRNCKTVLAVQAEILKRGRYLLTN